MSDKRYPTRMHEVLGVATEDWFTFSEYGDRKFWLSGSGLLYGAYDDGKGFVGGPATQGTLVRFINYPERITRRPRLTEEQVKRLRALIALEAMYLAKNKDGSVGAFTSKPQRNALYWNTNDSYVFYINIVGTCLSELVSWEDPEPLDIVEKLRQNGVEVER